MRFIVLAITLAASLVSAASLPRAAAAPQALRQATRNQVIRQMVHGNQRRQSRPSNGVYPVCQGSPANSDGAEKYAVVEDVELRNLATTLPLEVVNTETALDCANRCVTSPTCRGSQFTESANPQTDLNCAIYDDYTGGDSNALATSTFFGRDCNQIEIDFKVGPQTCCTYYSAPP